MDIFRHKMNPYDLLHNISKMYSPGMRSISGTITIIHTPQKWSYINLGLKRDIARTNYVTMLKFQYVAN